MCVALTLGALWLAHQWGPGQDGAFDSAFYLDGSRHLARGDGYLSAWTHPESHDFAPVTRWAPGFPALIAATMLLTNLPPLTAAAIVLGAAYALCILSIVLLSVELVGRSGLVLGPLTALLFATQPDTLAALDLVLSDLPGAALALLNAYLAVKIARAERCGYARLIAFGGCLSLMVMVRYAGALFVPGLFVALAIALLWRRRRWLDVLRTLAVPSVVLVATIAGWIARNRRLGPEPFGERVPSQATFLDLFDPAVRGAFSWWFTLRHIATDAEVEHLIVAATLLACGTGFALALANLARVREALLFTVLPSAAYFLLMMLAASKVRFDPIERARFWIAIWPLSFLALSAVIAGSARIWSRIASYVHAAILAAMLTAMLASLHRNLPTAQERRGLLDERWARAAAALPEPGACRLFVNDVRPFMLHRELGPTSETPQSRDDFEKAAARHAALCVATLSKRLRLSRTAESRRVNQNAVVEELRADGRLDPLGRSAGVTVYRWRTD